jgi:hypothetical protein
MGRMSLGRCAAGAELGALISPIVNSFGIVGSNSFPERSFLQETEDRGISIKKLCWFSPTGGVYRVISAGGANLSDIDSTSLQRKFADDETQDPSGMMLVGGCTNTGLSTIARVELRATRHGIIAFSFRVKEETFVHGEISTQHDALRVSSGSSGAKRGSWAMYCSTGAYYVLC